MSKINYTYNPGSNIKGFSGYVVAEATRDGLLNGMTGPTGPAGVGGIFLSGYNLLWSTGASNISDTSIYTLDGKSLVFKDGGINMSGHGITNLSEPTLPGDATTKNYVDNAIGVGTDLNIVNINASGTITGVNEYLTGNLNVIGIISGNNSSINYVNSLGIVSNEINSTDIKTTNFTGTNCFINNFNCLNENVTNINITNLLHHIAYNIIFKKKSPVYLL